MFGQYPTAVVGLLSSYYFSFRPFFSHYVGSDWPHRKKFEKEKGNDGCEIVDFIGLEQILLKRKQLRVIFKVKDRKLIGKLENFGKEVNPILFTWFKIG